MTDEDRDRFADMLTYAERASRYLGVLTVDDVVADDEKFSALLWSVSIVGEAASKLSQQAQSLTPDLPLAEARRMRNLLVHHYSEIDAATVIDTVRNDFPPLIEALKNLLRETPS